MLVVLDKQNKLFSDGGFAGYDQNQTQFQAQAQTPGNHPQQPPPPYSTKPYPQGYGNKPQYPGPYQGNPNQNQMPNPGMKTPMMNRQHIMQQFIRKPQPNPNLTANIMGHGGFNKSNFPNQVGIAVRDDCKDLLTPNAIQ